MEYRLAREGCAQPPHTPLWRTQILETPYPPLPNFLAIRFQDRSLLSRLRIHHLSYWHHVSSISASLDIFESVCQFVDGSSNFFSSHRQLLSNYSVSYYFFELVNIP